MKPGSAQQELMTAFGEKVIALINAEPPENPDPAGVTLGIGIGMLILEGSTDVEIYISVDAAIASARALKRDSEN